MRVGEQWVCVEGIDLTYASFVLVVGDVFEIVSLEENFLRKHERPDYADWDYMVTIHHVKTGKEFDMNSEVFFDHMERIIE